MHNTWYQLLWCLILERNFNVELHFQFMHQVYSTFGQCAYTQPCCWRWSLEIIANSYCHAWWLVARRVFVCFQNNTLYSWWILYRVCLCAVLLRPIDYNHVAAKHHARFMRHSKLGWIAVLAQFQIHLMQSFAELHNIVKQTPRTALIQNNSYEN